MSDAIRAGADASHKVCAQYGFDYYSREMGNGADSVEHRQIAHAVLDAATADVEAMARVLDPHSWRLHDDPRYDRLPRQARDSVVGKSMREAQAIRDWMLERS